MKKRIVGKLISLLMACVMIFCLVLPMDAKSKKKVTVIVEENNIVYEKNTSADISSENADGTVKKTETVNAKADADGTVKKVKVSEWLQNGSLNDTITDFTTLLNIKNTEGDEEFTRNSNGTIIWENHGENISYEGTTDEELPVSVKVRYFLENKEVSAQEIAGKTGNVKIRFEYTNHTAQTVLVNGKEVETVVPFVMCSMLYLPSDIFSNVEVENGSVMESQEQSIVLGYCLPGIADCFDFASYEPTEEIELEDFVEATAYASEFELEFTATVAFVGILDELELEDLNDLDETIDDMKELEKGANELVEGCDKLYDGVWDLRDGINEYMDAIDAVNGGVGELESGVYKLVENNNALNEGAKNLSESLTALNKMLSGLAFPENVDMSDMTAAVVKLNEDAAALSAALYNLQSSIDEAKQVWTKATKYQVAVSGKTESLKGVLDSIDTGAAASLANELAKEQAKTAALQALSISFENSGLTDDEIAAVKVKIEAAFADAVDGQISTGIDVSAAVVSVETKLTEAKNILADMPKLSLPEVIIDDTAIQEIIVDMNKQLEIIAASSGGLSTAVTALSGVEPMLLQLKEAVGQMDTGAKALAEGVAAYTNGVKMLYEGVCKLHEGTNELALVRGDFGEGMDELVNGVGELKDGVRQFRDDGISELTKLAGEDLRGLLNSLRAAKALNDTYDNFAGIAEGMEGEVIFIIETDSIEK